MNRILTIALNDLRQTLRDRLTFLFLLIMPVGFTLMFSLAFGGGAKPADPRLAVGLLDRDGSRLSGALGTLLASGSTLRLDESAGQSAAELDRQVTTGRLAAVLVIPAGFEAALRSGTPLPVEVVAPNSGSAGLVAQAAGLSALGRLESAVEAGRLAQAAGGSFDAALDAALAGWQTPPVALQIAAAPEAAAAGGLSTAQTAPGMMLQFGIAGLLTAAQVLVAERKSRCLQRLLVTRAARHEILLGHFLAIFAVIFAQFVLLMAFGQLALGLNYLRQPLASLVMALGSALFIAALGLLIGALAKTDEQAIIFAMVPMFLFAGLGGAWVPLETTGAAFQAIGHLTPVAWAMDGFRNILTRGLELNSVWLPAAALLGYAALFAALAAWKFKFE